MTNVTEDGLHCIWCEEFIIFCECEIVLTKEEKRLVIAKLREMDKDADL